jgi:hypothetical protein
VIGVAGAGTRCLAANWLSEDDLRRQDAARPAGRAILPDRSQGAKPSQTDRPCESLANCSEREPVKVPLMPVSIRATPIGSFTP